ncbi:MAG: hypothetical protein MJZ87_02490 [Bacteroidales bacterium]|nr:hypothetical protein [Bacteroidales bacterium]
MISTTTYQQSSLRSANGGYRYFFNGQESDGEVYGEGGLHAFEYRMHDTRTGRFWSVDPLVGKFPWNSTYAFAENSPIGYLEFEGLEIARPTRTVRRPAIGLRQYNYARIEDIRLPSLRITTTYTYRIGTSTGYRPTVSTPLAQYKFNYHSPQGNNISMTKDNFYAQRVTLLLELCDAYKTMYQNRVNTTSGIRESYRVQMGFADYRYQYQFDIMQLEYENQFRTIFNELPDTKMDFPAYMPQSWQQFWMDAEKAGREMDILGPSPQNYLERIMLFGDEQPYKVEIKTENIPEIRPAEP